MDYPLNLQLFADGGDGGAGAAGTSGVTQQDAAADTGAYMPDAAAHRRSGRRNPLADVQYGKGPEAQEQRQPAAQPQQDDAATRWQALKTGEMAKYFQQDVQQILRGRLKGAEENQQALDMLAPMLAEMAKKMGKDPKDLKGIVAQYMNDDSLYEEESIRTGTPIPVLKQLHELERRDVLQQRQLSQFTQEAQARAHYTSLIQQAEQLKATYPTFDLQKEMQDERFVRMTAPNGGCSVEEAYYALHHKEIAEQAMQYAASRAQQQTAQTVQANRARPVENGARGNRRAVDARTNPDNLTKRDLEEIARRVYAGDRSISF